ncbi:hypothetical protein ACF0H5_022319 [Mactra antiquata]
MGSSNTENKSKNGSKSNSRDTGRPPTTSVLRSAMYYQNRIIIPEKKRSPSQHPVQGQTNALTSSRGTAGNVARPTSLQQNSNTSINRSTGSVECVSDARLISGNSLQSNIADDVMDSAGIDIVVTDTDDTDHHVKKNPSILKRFYKCLQDNRMKGNPNAEEILASSNPQDYRVLKQVLNFSFLSIGIALLVAVVIVIIYSLIDPT